jgi:beta-glucosidase
MRATIALLLFLAAARLGQPQEKYKDVTASAEERAADLVSRMTLEEKVSQMQNNAPAIPRLDIPAYEWWNEALHGVARAGLATVFPQAIGLAATWDKNLEHTIADTISTEARAKYNDAIAHGNHNRYYGLTFWSPNINIFRDPRWGRGQETYGEDPYLTSQMAIQFIKGMQGDDPHYFKTIATSKHYAVHSGPELLRHGFNTQVTEDELNNTYLYAFRQTVEQAHVDSFMCVYNAIDGVPGCANNFLLQKTLREGWKFKGYVVSDCDSVDDIYTGHHYTKTLAEAAALAVKAGTDLDCGRSYNQLTTAVHQGLLTEDDINRSVVRLFTARFQLGMFDPPEKVPYSKLGLDVVQSPEHQRISLQAAREAIVLLKNDKNFLPLAKTPRRIAIVGPAADDPDAMLGNYNGIPSHIETPLAGIEKEFGSIAKVEFALGSSYVAGWSALVPQNVLAPEAQSPVHGLRAEYFTSEDFTGSATLSRTEPRVFFSWETQDPAILKAVSRERFAIRWTGYLHPKASGEYQLGAIRPECHTCGRVDAARLYIDDQLLTNDAKQAGEQMYSKTRAIQLAAGKTYRIRIEYTQHGGGGGLQLVWTPPADAALAEAVNLVKSSDVAIACVGLNSRLEGEESPLKVPGFAGGDRTDIRLPESQRNLLDALFKTGKPVVVVLVNGSALAIPEARENASAILETWYGGQEAGTALAETLAGKNNPGGRLPVTFYASLDQVPPFTDYSMKNRTYRFFTGTPIYPFGYGLSYSHFVYSNARLETGSTTARLHATVQNKSSRDGDEVVEVYLTLPDGSNPQLRAFDRIHLKAGESRSVEFTLDNSDLKGRVVSIGQPSALKLQP